MDDPLYHILFESKHSSSGSPLHMIRCLLVVLISTLILTTGTSGQSGSDDYWLNNPFSDGETVITNTGHFYDAGGWDNYSAGEDWTVTFCSENGNPITVEFDSFATDYRGTFPPPQGSTEYLLYDYMSINYPGASYVAYNDDTPQFSFTSPDGCITFGFHSNEASLTENGWWSEISANPPPPNNDPCNAIDLPVGNVCSPGVYNNKGSWDTRGLGNPSCHKFFGGDVWFSAVVPASGELKIASYPGTLTWAVVVLYRATDCNNFIQEVDCDDAGGGMPTLFYSGTPGETIYIRVFGDQAKSGTFGICATDPAAAIEGYTGPGGVGNALSNELWFKADAGALDNSDNPALNNTPVKTWQDHSGNDSHLVQSSAANQPSLFENSVNGLPVIRFDGNDDHYFRELGNLSAPLEFISVTSFNASQDQTLLSLGNLNNNNTVSFSRESDNRYYSYTLESKFYGPVISNGTAAIIHATHNTSSSYHELDINASGQTVSDYGSAVTTDGSFSLGSSKDMDKYLHADLAEAIVYTRNLNQTQKIIVNNYLAAKYDLNIGGDDRYAHELSHGYDVAGIGRINQNDLHSKAQSAGILSIGGATDLEDNEFLIFGHNNGDINAWTDSEAPNGDANVRRLAREWIVDITAPDGLGAVNIGINDSLLPSMDPGFLSLNLWVDSDGNFSSGAAAYGLVSVGNEYVANGVILNDGDHITIGKVKPIIEFDAPSSSGLETVANPIIPVSMNYAVSQAVSIQYAVKSGTATGGNVDYNLNPGSLNFNAGQKTTEIIPLIQDDDLAEVPDEYFIIRLYAPDPEEVILGNDSLHRYTIIDDDIEVNAFTDKDTISECAGSYAQLGVNVIGRGPYTYSWTPVDSLDDPSIANPKANPSVTTTYTVIVEETSSGATDTDTVRITVMPKPAKPTITAGGDTEFCEGDSVVLSSSPGVDYLWSNGETTPSITVKTSGNYTVRVSDEYGCFSDPSDAVNVSVHPLPAKPDITASGPTTFCDGDSVKLSAPDADGYLWSNGATGREIHVLTSGSYTVQVLNAAGCISEPSDPVVTSLAPIPDKPVITGDTEYCEGNFAVLTGPAAAGYLWSTGETSQTIEVTAGSYTLKAYNTEGCESPASDPFTVTENPTPDKPTITADGPLEFFEGDSVKLTGSPADEYLWSPGDQTTQSITVKTSGTYSVQVRNSFGCISVPSDEVKVTVKSLGKPVIQADGPTEFCAGGQVVLTSSEGENYLWSTGATTQSITVSESGSYSVLILDDHGHSGPLSDPVNVTVHQLPQLTVSHTDVSCYGEATGSAMASASGGGGNYSYSWSDGTEGPENLNLTAGTYTLTVTDANNCSSVASVEIEQPDPININRSTENAFCPDIADGSISVSAEGGVPPYSYLWQTGSTDRTLNDLLPGTYDLLVTDNNNCEEEFDISVGYDNEFCLTIPGIITPNGDEANDTWVITGIEAYPDAEVEVFDRWGKRVFYSKGYDEEWDGTFNGRELPMDSYHYVIKLNNGTAPVIGNITIVR